MLFFTEAILLCAVRDAQCKTRASKRDDATHAHFLTDFLSILFDYCFIKWMWLFVYVTVPLAGFLWVNVSFDWCGTCDIWGVTYKESVQSTAQVAQAQLSVECTWHVWVVVFQRSVPGADLGGGCRGCTPPLRWPALFQYNWYSAKKKRLNYVVYWCWSRARDERTPSEKKSRIRPWVQRLWRFVWDHYQFDFKRSVQIP